MTAPRTVSVAGLALVVPDGCVGRVLSDSSAAAAVATFVAHSPDATLYHQGAYIDFARKTNGAADLLLLERDGAAQFAVPVHPLGSRTMSTGYSGVLFPPGSREATLKRAVRTLKGVVEHNAAIGLRGLQAGHAAGYDDRDRTALLACLAEQEGLAGPSMWCRVIDRPSGWTDGSSDDVELAGYDGDVRNQIRQARRKGVEVECLLPADVDAAVAAYREFVAVHEESWRRTGLRPHPLDYWLDLNAAVVQGGGRDLIVLARSDRGEVVATVTCHIYEDRAIYWAGGSRSAGLQLRANPLCLHTAISTCWSLGVSVFELGRFSAAERDAKEGAITHYKSQFGGRVLRLSTLSTPRTRAQWVSEQLYRARRRLAGAT